jgi:aminoglycoside 6'-N-acetyltransferase I
VTTARDFTVRSAVAADSAALAELRAGLWPETSAAEHKRELDAIFAGSFKTVLPATIFVAESSDAQIILGFLEAGLRSCADGCDMSRPVGYVEGWFVIAPRRGQRIGRALLAAAEEWARSFGCREMASDADIANTLSQRVHEAAGFIVAGRSVLYRKAL